MQQDLSLGDMLKAKLAKQPTKVEKLEAVIQKIRDSREYEIKSIGESARHHGKDAYDDLSVFLVGESVHSECRLQFKLLEEYDADIRKAIQAMGVINKLVAKYLD